MKLLLAVLQLTLVPQVPVPGSEPKASAPPSENKQKVLVYDFEDDGSLGIEQPASEWECFTRCHLRRWALIRVRENFDDKVMQSVHEL